LACALEEDTGEIDELDEPTPYGEPLSKLQFSNSFVFDFSVIGGVFLSSLATLNCSLFENEEFECDGDFSTCELFEESLLFLGDWGESVSCLVLFKQFGESDLGDCANELFVIL
jgi:hypothetical protein